VLDRRTLTEFRENLDLYVSGTRSADETLQVATRLLRDSVLVGRFKAVLFGAVV
jgi:hypothetical protein